MDIMLSMVLGSYEWYYNNTNPQTQTIYLQFPSEPIDARLTSKPILSG